MVKNKDTFKTVHNFIGRVISIKKNEERQMENRDLKNNIPHN